MRLLVFGASLRSNSLNVSLARLAAEYLKGRGVEVDLASFGDFDAPSYNQDLLDSSGFPPPVLAFINRLRAADAFAIALSRNGMMVTRVPGTRPEAPQA